MICDLRAVCLDKQAYHYYIDHYHIIFTNATCDFHSKFIVISLFFIKIMVFLSQFSSDELNRSLHLADDKLGFEGCIPSIMHKLQGKTQMIT